MCTPDLFEGTEFEDCGVSTKQGRSHRCRYCKEISRTKTILNHSSKQRVPNTTCPKCGRQAAFAKSWLLPTGEMRLASSVEDCAYNTEMKAILITSPSDMPVT